MFISPLLPGHCSPSSGATFTVCLLHRCIVWCSLVAVAAAAAGLQLLDTHRLLDRCLQQFELLLLVKACIFCLAARSSSSFCGCGCCKS